MASPSDPGYCNRNAAGTGLIVISSILFAIATVIVPTRLWVRLSFKSSPFDWDDACLIAAYLLLAPSIALIWRMIDLGLGKRIGCYTADDQSNALEYEYIAEVMMIFSGMFSRISVALFVTKLFATTKRLKIMLYLYTIFMAISMMVTGVLPLAQCTPIQALWDYRLEYKAKCWSVTAIDFIDYYNSAVTILSDCLLALLPSYFLVKLKMKTSAKVGLMLLMAVGLAPMSFAIVRTIFASLQGTSDDPLYSLARLIIFGTSETQMLLICASIPGLSPLFHTRDMHVSQISSRLRSWMRGSRSGSQSTNTSMLNSKNGKRWPWSSPTASMQGVHKEVDNESAMSSTT